ncbi:MAG: polyphosphate polymerase domain-containing protein [Eubacterium sp.]|nr:polyphosphate polymerase domain-containing protein [Eubacterium sp.]
MVYRHEMKQEITMEELLILRQRLSAVLKRDAHAVNGIYEIRSLYFDNARDKALREKKDGINIREKFRIRYYNGNTKFIKLEKKSKMNGLSRKDSTLLTKEQTQDMINGEYEWMKASEAPLVRELYIKMMTEGLRPKTVVDYVREPFVFAPGNVRVTLDYNIRTGILETDMFNPQCVMVPAGDAPIILEIKWDAYLPDLIKDLVHLENSHNEPFSKYAACRIYG